MFAYDHALHHLAIIKMGLLSAFPQIKVDENMGVSPATLKNQNQALPTRKINKDIHRGKTRL